MDLAGGVSGLAAVAAQPVIYRDLAGGEDRLNLKMGLQTHGAQFTAKPADFDGMPGHRLGRRLGGREQSVEGVPLRDDFLAKRDGSLPHQILRLGNRQHLSGVEAEGFPEVTRGNKLLPKNQKITKPTKELPDPTSVRLKIE